MVKAQPGEGWGEAAPPASPEPTGSSPADSASFPYHAMRLPQPN